AKTDETKLLHIKFTGTKDGTSSIKRDKNNFPDVVSRNQSQALVKVQNIFLDYPEPKRVTPIPIIHKSTKNVYSHIRDTISVTGPIFLPSHLSASTQIFRKETKQVEHSRKSPKTPHKVGQIYFDEKFQNILILSSTCTKSANVPCLRFLSCQGIASLSHFALGVPSGQTNKGLFYFPTCPIVFPPGCSSLQSAPRSVCLHTELRHQPSFSKTLRSSLAKFPGWAPTCHPLAPPSLSAGIVGMLLCTQAAITHLNCVVFFHYLGVPRRKINYSDAHILRGEGFRTVAATGYETVTAMTEPAIVNRQMHGRNALNLKGFFITSCPDLTPLAFQLIYLNLSFSDLSKFPTEIFCLKNLQILKLRNNPIKAIPSDIQQLKFLRIFSVAFNFISDLPFGLFSLSHLEELDVSYNEITSIPNDIQKLRSLEKLNIDGNYLFYLPSGILKFNLTKISFENTFTHHRFWTENSLISPPRLMHISSLFIVRNDLFTSYGVSPVKIQRLLK
ncbi:Leucine-rich repeat-containing protein 63, partial [Heterocephalus glaber]